MFEIVIGGNRTVLKTTLDSDDAEKIVECLEPLLSKEFLNKLILRHWPTTHSVEITNA